MRSVGIIAEYNPLHTGHKYHIQKARRMANADYTVVVMSPDFVQRGTPAIFDKYTRTRMALLAGADLVLELPICYATGKAQNILRAVRSGCLMHSDASIPCVSEARRQTAIFSHSWLTSLYLSRPCIRTCCAGSKRQERHFRRHAPRHLRQCLQTGIMNFCDSSPCQTIFLRSNTAKRCSSSLLLFYRFRFSGRAMGITMRP